MSLESRDRSTPHALVWALLISAILTAVVLMGIAAAKAGNGLELADYQLQRWYWYSQIALSLFALIAAVVAFVQYQHTRRQNQVFRTFEIIRHLEREEVREARRIVMSEIPDGRSEEWWESLKSNDKRRTAAAQLCSVYSHMGLVFAKFGLDDVGDIFLDQWGETAVLAHEYVLPGYLEYRRRETKKAYEGFDWFYAEAKKRHPNVRRASQTKAPDEPVGQGLDGGSKPELLAGAED